MTTVQPDNTPRQLAPREGFMAEAPHLLWRVTRGALRIDSAPQGEASRFVRLALPGDVVGVERWAGTHDSLSQHALIASELVPVQASGPEMMQILMESVVVAHQRCREVVSLRTGPAARRIQALLLMFAHSAEAADVPVDQAAHDVAVPNLADLSDILDVAPETVSRVFGSLREHNFLQGRRPQKARFSTQALRGLEIVAGMSGAIVQRKVQLAVA